MAQQSLTGPKVLVSDAITEADTNTTKRVLEIPAGSYIPPYGVSVIVVEAFAGGTPSLDVGDSGDPDGWVDTTDITEATPATYSGTEANTGNDAIAGKYYASADYLEVVVSASLTDGTAYVVAQVYDFSDVSLAAA